ncbi:dipeptide/oligopeptide/nickel ABC transporter ATP-binding protein [Sulfolobales archaeon HS-7]|nr:dipeptide/oligopeptide/nickel ABC transporter ATP-binding protein [Sulfolobales archaeon HS-7]
MDEVFKLERVKKYYLATKRGILDSLFGRPKFFVKAVDDVSFSIYKGEVLGLVGESGSGKTTLGKILATLEEPTDGKMYFNGKLVAGDVKKEIRKQVHMVFQNPMSSLNPRLRVKSIVAEPLRKFNEPLVKKSLEMVGLDYTYIKDKLPRELSGGQLQRVAIARALVKNPTFLVLDEPTSALDASVQSQILNLLAKIQRELNITYLFITHNISVARYIADRIVVLYAGKIAEEGNTEDVLTSPAHPYTQALLDSVPTITKKDIKPPTGEVPSLINPPSGCRFHPRCPFVMEICRKNEPPLVEKGRQRVACWLYKGRVEKNTS